MIDGKKINAIISAGGKGTRMKSDSPKCACKFSGKPMINYIIDSCKKSGIDEIVTIVGYKKEDLIACLPNDVKWVVQEEQLGTAHATNCAKQLLGNSDGLTLIFPGDTPLLDESVINGLIQNHIKNGNDLTLVTSILDDALAYGRIYRENGKVKKIIEFKDCTEEQKKIKEFNVALYCVDNKLLFNALDKVSNDNKAKEYYLTDIVEILGKDHKVDTYVVKYDYRFTGINDMETLKELENIYFNIKNNR